MKKILLSIILSTGSLFAQTNDAPIITAIDGYAAQVGTTVITYGEIRETVAQYMPQLLQRYKGEELAQQIQKLHWDAREALIEETLIKEEASELGLALPSSSIDEEINRLIRERFDNDRTLLSRTLAARRMTFDEWRESISDQITLQVYYRQEVTSRATVSKAAIRIAYEENRESLKIPFNVKFRAILINKGVSAEDQAIKKQQAEELLKKLRNGADFAETAQEFSEGIRADNGGEFPWGDPEDIREELRPTLYNVAAGQISEIIETDSEFYIVKIEARREEGTVPFEEVSGKIEAKLLRIEQDRLHDELIERLTKRHFVKRY